MTDQTLQPTIAAELNPQPVDILQTVASHFWLVELRGTALATSKTYKPGAHVLAADTGGQEAAFRSSLKLFPKGYDFELKPLQKAFNAVREHFNTATRPYAMGVSETGDGSTRAQGPRLLATKAHYDGRFLNEHAVLMQDLVAAKSVFVSAYPGLLQQIEAENALGSAFDLSKYPTLEQVDASWTYELIGPSPLADASNLQNRAVPLSPAVAQAIEARMQRQAETQLENALQDLAKTTLERVRKLSERLAALREYQDTPTDPNAPKTRKPPFFESVFSNLRQQAELLRAYAVPGTQIGADFERLADEIETNLAPPQASPKSVAESPALAEQIGASAAEISNAFENLQVLY